MAEKITEVSLEAADNFAQGKIVRLKRVKEENGVLRWAVDLGKTLVTGLALLATDETRLKGEKILEYLKPQLKEVSIRPDLSYYFVDGIVKELEKEGFFKKD